MTVEEMRALTDYMRAQRVVRFECGDLKVEFAPPLPKELEELEAQRTDREKALRRAAAETTPADKRRQW